MELTPTIITFLLGMAAYAFLQYKFNELFPKKKTYYPKHKKTNKPTEFEKPKPPNKYDELGVLKSSLYKTDTYVTKTHLTTSDERKLLCALQAILNKNQFMIHCETTYLAPVNPQEHWSAAAMKRVDFVITDTASKILATIELDGSSHMNEKSKRNDEYKNYLLYNRHPLIRIKSRKYYDQEYIASRLEKEAGIKLNT